jgi:pseudaminic acid cytidylyltransferase
MSELSELSNRCIAIIPARGGSKRIPKKNIKTFAGKPLISYSITEALNSGLFDRVIVSTDDPEIEKIAKAYGAEVPIMRPSNLADDHTGTGDVVNHMIEWLESQGEDYSYYCTIYATAPLLQAKYLQKGLKLLKESDDAVSAISVTSMPFTVHRTFEITEENRLKMFWPEHFSTRSQDLPEAYQDAGQFYWVDRQREIDRPKAYGFSDHIIPVILPRYRVQDIDTLEDWDMAELLYQALQIRS